MTPTTQSKAQLKTQVVPSSLFVYYVKNAIWLLVKHVKFLCGGNSNNNNSNTNKEHLLCFWIWKNLYDMMRRGRRRGCGTYTITSSLQATVHTFMISCVWSFSGDVKTLAINVCLSPSLPSPCHCNVVLLLLSFVRLEYAASPSGILCIILIFVKLSTRPVFMRHSHRWLHTPPKSNGPKTRCGHDKVFRQGLIRLQIYELLMWRNSWAAVEKNFQEIKENRGSLWV